MSFNLDTIMKPEEEKENLDPFYGGEVVIKNGNPVNEQPGIPEKKPAHKPEEIPEPKPLPPDPNEEPEPERKEEPEPELVPVGPGEEGEGGKEFNPLWN